MVANQVADKGGMTLKASLTDLKKVVTQLVLSESGKKATNATEWDSSLRTLFASFDLSGFLLKSCGIQVASDKVADIVVNQQVEALLAEWNKRQGKGVKQEDEDENEVSLRSLMQERAQEMHAEMVKESAENEMRQVREVTFFLEWLTAVPPELKGKNPRAKYHANHNGKEWLMELESPKKREQRQVAWELIIHSISGLSGIPKSSWNHVPIGNVHQLYKLVFALYKSEDRTALVQELTDRMNSFRKSKSETFAAFWGRFEKMRTEMREIKMKIDHDVMKVIFYKAIEKGEDKKAKKAYQQMMMAYASRLEEIANVDLMYEKMEMTMKAREAEENEKEDEKFEKAKKKKDKKARQKARKARELAESSDSSDSSEDEKAVALKATANRSQHEDVRGVCSYFQNGTCSRGKQCNYEHRKLSQEGNRKLQDMMKEAWRKKNERGAGVAYTPIRCYECQKEGHIANQCPEKNGKQSVKKTNMTVSFAEKVKEGNENMSETERLVRKATAGLSVEQMKEFAKEVIELNEKMASKKQY